MYGFNKSLKKTLSVFLVAVMLVCGVPFSSSAVSEVPDGYTGISTVEELYSMRYDLDGKFILLEDIDLSKATASGGDWDTNGYGWLPIGESSSAAFTGELDGNGHKLIGLQIRDSSVEYVGLFGYLSGATVKNLTLESPSVTSNRTYSGTLCGVAENSTIDNIQITDLTMTSKRGSDSYFGGLCGWILGTTVSRVGLKNINVSYKYYDYRYIYCIGGIVGSSNNTCQISRSYVTGAIKLEYYDYAYSSSDSPGLYIGGVLGRNSSGSTTTISNCYNSTDIDIKSHYNRYPNVGGIIGHSSSKTVVEKCLNLGNITSNSSNSHLGAISGYPVVSYLTLSGNYYLRGTASSGAYNTSDTAATAIALTEAQMKLKSVFGNLDFENTWFLDINSGVLHPQLKGNREARDAESLIIVSQPEKTTYYHHDEIDLTGLEVEVKYNDLEGTYPLNVTDDMFANLNTDSLGITEVTVTYLGQTASFKIFVVERPVDSVTLDTDAFSIDVGETKALDPTVLPETATDRSLTWSSSNEDVAKVDENGVVTAIARGSAEITCESKNGITDTCEVTVLLPAKSVTLESECTINKNEEKKLEVTADPSDTTDTFSWKSNDKKIVTVDDNGVIKGVGKGSTFVTVTSSRGLMATCIVTVLVPVTKLTISESELTINVGKTATLTAEYLPSDTTDALAWSSSDESVATVSKNGVVTAVSKGTAEISYIASSGMKVTCKVNVVVPATGATLNLTEVKLVDNITASLTAEVTPENANDKSVVWGSEDESIAVVNEYGVVSGVGTGKTRVYAQLHTGIRVYCDVEVVINPTSITFEDESITVKQNSSAVLTPIFAPEKALKTVTWESSAPEIASVDENGKVTGVSEGTATIKATSANGLVSASVTVNVPHEHTVVTVNAVAATHFAEGNIKYYKCADCGKLYSDSTCKNEIALDDTVIEIIPHTYSDEYSSDETGHWNECSCGEKNNFTEHTFGEYTTTLEPTCTEEGREKKTCSVCGYNEYRSTSPIGHNFESNWTVDKVPTCTRAGTESRHCSRCDERTDERSIAATGHTFGEYTTTLEPTCTEEGREKRTCSVCGYNEYRSISPIGHDFETNWTVDKVPTCTRAGTESRHCSRCDERTDERSIAATGHTEVADAAVSPTCTVNGKTAGKHCGKCGLVLVTQTTIPATGHKDENDDGYCDNCNKELRLTILVGVKKTIEVEDDEVTYIQFVPTVSGLYEFTSYSEDDTYGYICDINKEVIERDDDGGTGRNFAVTCELFANTVYYLGAKFYSNDSGSMEVEISCLEEYCDHNEVEVEEGYAPTCTEEGLTDGTYCTNCGEILVEPEVIPATGHSFGAWETTKSATCTAKGTKERTCSVCDEVETKKISALGHNYSSSWTIDTAATCSEAGSKSHHCTRCSAKTDVTAIAKTSHTYGSWKTTKKATCTAKGSKERVCTECGYKQTQATAALGHNYSSSWTIDTAATCSQAGSKSHHCTRCSAKTDVTAIAKTSHTYGSWTTTKKATCTASGSKKRTCTVCGYTQTQATAALGHNYSSSWTIDKEATCSQAGSKSHHCTRCGAKGFVTEIEAKGHSYKSTTAKKATTSADGKVETKCTVCGSIKSSTKIAKISSIKLSNTSYTYDGNSKKPTVTVKDSSGNTLKSGTDYTVTYASGRKNVGVYNVTVTFKGKYSGSKTLTFKINPKAVSVSKVTGGAGKLTVSWSKSADNADGYQLQYSTSSGMSNAKTKTVSGGSTTSAEISGLSNNKTYYVRVRSFKTVKSGGENVKLYSAWSSVKSGKTLKIGVTLNKTSLTLMKGKSATLKATVSPSNAKISWKSSDTSVAKVSSNGKISAVGAGTATITASFKHNGTTYKATCKVTVKVPSIKLNKTSATTYTGSTLNLKATTTPDNVDVTWKSSNTSVAKVSSSGKVSGVSAGTATITASFKYGGKTYSKSCKVTVKTATDRSRYNNIIKDLRENGSITETVPYEGQTMSYEISQSEGTLIFSCVATYKTITEFEVISYTYGDAYAYAVGSYYMGSTEICTTESRIPVDEYYYGMTVFTEIKYSPTYADSSESFFSINQILIDTTLLFANVVFRTNYGYGLNKIGFTSYKES